MPCLAVDACAVGRAESSRARRHIARRHAPMCCQCLHGRMGLIKRCVTDVTDVTVGPPARIHHEASVGGQAGPWERLRGAYRGME